MYLLVFVTFVVGLISVYGQILSVQSARIASRQTGFAQTMRAWHFAAVSMASNVVQNGVSPTATGCMLTDVTGMPSICRMSSPPPCTPYGVVYQNSPSNSSGKFKAISGGCEGVHLPPQYNAKYYQFYSALYADTVVTGGNYVVTWVPPPAVTTAPYIKLPSGYQTSLTMSDLALQLRNVSKAAPHTYGIVKNHKLKLGTIKLADATYALLEYAVPDCVVDGSIGLISSVQ